MAGVQANQQSANRSEDASLSESFQQILAMSMMSGGMDSSQGSGMSSMMLPLMLLLIEKLLALQTEQASAEESHGDDHAAVEAGAETASVEPAVSSNYGDQPTPRGRPVVGVLSQNYHASHYGLDIAIPTGTPVKTTMDGKVVYAGWNNQGYGNLVIVENGAYRTYYAHLSEIPVKIGDKVSAGSVIGLSGNTGNSTGPHLHYEIRINMKPIDPTDLTLR